MESNPATQGLKVREARVSDATSIARVHVDAWRETYTGLLPRALLDGLRYEDRETLWSSVLKSRAETEFVFVAEWNTEVCGFASGGRERSNHPLYAGELYAIYVLNSAQKRSAGRLLFEAVRAKLKSEGFHSMLVWVLERNAACGFYEAMGGQRAGEKDESFGDAVLREVAYGWTAG